MSNKVLTIIFGVLVAAFLLSKMLGGNKSRSFDPQIVQINSEEITELIIAAPGTEPATVQKEQGQWIVSNGANSYKANETVVSSMIREMSSIEADKVISRSLENAAKYGTDGDSGTKITAKSDAQILTEIIVGRFSFNQQTRQPISYVRLSDEDETYLIGSFMASSLNKDFNGLRDKSLLSLTPSEINSIQYKSDNQEFSLDLGMDNNWITSNESAVDSASVAQFLNTLSNKSGVQFTDTSAPSNSGESIRFNSQGSSIQVFATMIDEDKYVIYSDQHPDNIFESTGSSIYQQIFGKFKDLVNPE